ncbi:hypothetical protein FG93_01967 [Bosea sp. LC85]|uniref:hypothetical protein n=1 Tax=Bosea sp. LC85 TaxID=1502851 RepID=UPI0004E309CA|nr:hypothetical protein [Bosea sp. LC85]KFC73223.1 hypothetical protein FG93_01967 [Bosea sp. LC85]
MAALFEVHADALVTAAMASRIEHFVGAMRDLDPALAEARRAGVVPTSQIAAEARAFWMSSQAALASAVVFVQADRVLDGMTALAARNERLAPYVLSTLMADRARRIGAPPRPSRHFERPQFGGAA